MFTITVHPWQRALERKGGAPTRVLGPGRHRRRWRADYTWMDARQQMDTVAPQEVLTADGVTAKVTAVVRWRIGDPVRFAELTADPVAVVYLAVQLALRAAYAEVVTGRQRAVAQLEAARAETVELK